MGSRFRSSGERYLIGLIGALLRLAESHGYNPSSLYEAAWDAYSHEDIDEFESWPLMQQADQKLVSRGDN